jgi:hypothetical protein
MDFHIVMIKLSHKMTQITEYETLDDADSESDVLTCLKKTITT